MRYILFIMLAATALACSPLTNKVTEDTVLCKGNYNITSLEVMADLDCNNSMLTCKSKLASGIRTGSNITIKNCFIKGCEYGILSTNANITIKNSTIQDNKIGVALENSALETDEVTFRGNEDEIRSISPIKEPEMPGENENQTTAISFDNEVVKEMMLDIISKTNISQDLAERIINDTRDLNITIQKTYTITDNTTKVTIKTSGKDLQVFEEIPKCAAEHASSIIFHDDPIILDPDPLISWEYHKAITYSIPKSIPDNCRRLFQTAITKRLSSYKITETNQSIEIQEETTHTKTYISLSIVLILLVLIFFRMRR